jgi:hypothetical protein
VGAQQLGQEVKQRASLLATGCGGGEGALGEPLAIV